MSNTSAGLASENSLPETRRLEIRQEPIFAHSNAAVVRYNENKRLADPGYPQSHPASASLQAGELRHRAQNIVDVMSSVGIAAAVLGEGGLPIATNAAFKKLTPELLRSPDRPRFIDSAAEDAVADALRRRLQPGNASISTQMVPIRARGGKPRAIAYLVPIESVQLRSNSVIWTLLLVKTLQPSPTPSLQILQRVFGLSPAEARVAHGIAARKTIGAIASDFRISRETVRSQLKTVLAKTGTKRQLDLAMLLCSLLPIES